jgi:LysR family transcriptional regulator, cell division regulator
MDIRLNDLKNFVETATCSTMTEAAIKLQITQPALSESIKRLESDLGETLFYRSRTGINLTPSGRTTFERAKNAVGALAELSLSKHKSAAPSRPIVIGAHATVANYGLPDAFKNLAKSYPEFKISLKHGLSRQIQHDVQKGLIDVAIVINPQPVPDIVIKKIGIDHVAVWSGTNINQEKIIYHPELFQTQFILRKWKRKFTDVIETDNLELITRFVEQGVGYGIIPERAVHLVGAKLKRHDDFPSYKDEIALVHRPEFGKNDFERFLIDSLAKAYG